MPALSFSSSEDEHDMTTASWGIVSSDDDEAPGDSTKWFHARLTDEQSAAWREAELIAGIQAKERHIDNHKRKKKKEAHQAAPLVFVDCFAESKQFRGSVNGYSFRLGCKGQGYYRERPQISAEPNTDNDDIVKARAEAASTNNTTRASGTTTGQGLDREAGRKQPTPRTTCRRSAQKPPYRLKDGG